MINMKKLRRKKEHERSMLAQHERVLEFGHAFRDVH